MICQSCVLCSSNTEKGTGNQHAIWHVANSWSYATAIPEAESSKNGFSQKNRDAAWRNCQKNLQGLEQRVVSPRPHPG